MNKMKELKTKELRKTLSKGVMEEKITIMRYNKPVAVLVPYSQYEKERDHPALEVVMQIEREPQATVTISLIRYLRLIQLETKVC